MLNYWKEKRVSNVNSVKDIDLSTFRKPRIAIFQRANTKEIIAFVRDRDVTLYTLEYSNIKDAVDDIQKNWHGCEFCLRGTEDVERLIGVFV